MNKKSIAAAFLLVLFLVGCIYTSEIPAAYEGDVTPEYLSSDTHHNEKPLPESEELAVLVTRLREADASLTSVTWWRSDDTTTSLRITSELLFEIADVLATEPYTQWDGDVLDGMVRWPEWAANMEVRFNDDPLYAPFVFNFEFSLLSFDEHRNGEFADNMLLNFTLHDTPGDPTSMRFTYPRSTYDRLTQVIEAFTAIDPPSIEGNYIIINSPHTEIDVLGSSDTYILNALDFGDRIFVVFRYNVCDSLFNYGMDVLNARTGESTATIELGAHYIPPTIERINTPPYDYRILFTDRVEYRSGSDIDLVTTFMLPEEVPQHGFSMLFYSPRPNDICLTSGLIAFGMNPFSDEGEGIYLSDLDLGNRRLVLSNADIPIPDEDWFCVPRYGTPLLMNGGRQLVSTIYVFGNEKSIGAVVMDLQTEEQHRVIDFAGCYWTSVRRIDERTIGYYVHDDQLGRMLHLLDVETMQIRIVVGMQLLRSHTNDFYTFVETVSDRTERGEVVSTLYVYELENREEKTALLTVTNGLIRIRAVTENFVLCEIYPGVFIIVPLSSAANS